MDLLIVANDFPTPFQPLRGIFNLYLAGALAGQQHRVRVICPIPWVDERAGRRAATGGKTEGGDLPRGRRRMIDQVQVDYPRYWYPPKVLRNHYGWFYWQSIRATVGRLLQEGRPDVVIGYWAHPDGEAAIRIARQAQVPAGVILGGSDVLLLTRQAGRRRRILKVLHTAEALITVNHHLKEKVMELGIRGQKVHVWQQGVDGAWFYPGSRGEARRRLGLPLDQRVVIWVGRMVPVKGLEVLLQACAAESAGRRAFHLYLVGDGPLHEFLAAETQRRGLGERVSFAGACGHARLGDWYRAADLTVLPSWSEGLPNVLRESLACGTRFVASQVGGIAEIAAGTTSRLVAPGDAHALAQAIDLALGDPAPVWLSEPALPSWENAARTMVEIFLPLLAGSVAEPAGERNFAQ